MTCLEAQGFVLLPIDLHHVLRVVGLSMIHRDPFVAAYDVQIIWASVVPMG